jgi:intracellular septation protein
MHLLIDLIPVFAFFGIFRFARAYPDLATGLLTPLIGPIHAPPALAHELPAILLATLATLLATVIQIGGLLLARRHVRPTVWVGAAIIVVFGGLTVWLQDETFIKWKPTILYWTFAGALGGGRLLFGRNLLGLMLGDDLQLPTLAWDRLLLAWTTFFLAMGAANLFVAFTMSTDAWVDFKTFGATGLTFVFSIVTALVLMRNAKVGEGSQGAGGDA